MRTLPKASARSCAQVVPNAKALSTAFHRARYGLPSPTVPELLPPVVAAIVMPVQPARDVPPGSSAAEPGSRAALDTHQRCYGTNNVTADCSSLYV